MGFGASASFSLADLRGKAGVGRPGRWSSRGSGEGEGEGEEVGRLREVRVALQPCRSEARVARLAEGVKAETSGRYGRRRTTQRLTGGG